MNDKTKLLIKDLKTPQRFSFLLRLWSTSEAGCDHWQASLENPKTGKRIGFDSLEQLFAYLMDLSECDCNVQDTENKK